MPRSRLPHQLIESLAGKFEPREKYHDTFEENLKELIKAHMEGREVTAVETSASLLRRRLDGCAFKESLARMPKKPPNA